MRKITFGLGMSVLLLVGAACASATTAPAASNEPIKLVVWSSHNGVFEEDMQVVADAFMEERPNVTIEIQVVPNEEFLTRLLTASASRSGPDITYWSDQFITTVLDKDIFAPLPEGMFDDYFEQVTPAWRDSYIDSAGNRVGVPYFGGPWGFDYRLDYMHDAGIDDFPSTWSELIEFCQKTVQKDSEGNITREGVDWLLFDPFAFTSLDQLMATQGQRVVALDGSVNLNSPEALAALQLMHDTIWKYECSLPLSQKATPPAGSLPITAGLAASITLWPGSPGFYFDLQQSDPDFNGRWDKATLFPKPDEGGVDAYISVADGWAVLNTSQHKDEAFAYIKALTADDVMVTASEFASVVRNDVMTSPEVKAYFDENAKGAIHVLDFWSSPQISAASQSAIRSVNGLEIQQIVTDGIVAALEDPNADLAAALETMQVDVIAAMTH